MMHKLYQSLSVACLFFLPESYAQQKALKVETKTGTLELPAPNEAASTNKFSNVIGWPKDKTPLAPQGFKVEIFANGIKSPRNLIQLPNGDVLVSLANSERSAADAEKNRKSGKINAEVGGLSANKVMLYRDTNGDVLPDESFVYLEKLKQPYGLALIGQTLYVANTDGILTFPYREDETKNLNTGKKIVSFTGGGYNNHWTRNLITNRNKTKIYASVGSASNVGEFGMDQEIRRANILEINPDGSGEIIYGAGLRNPVGMDWNPITNELWTVVNERDILGDDLVPDYLTSVKKGGFYGWPYAYFGPNEDPRQKEKAPELVKKTIVPDVPLGSHTASLGLRFYTGNQFPEKYKNGAFVGQHGSWNSSKLVGYKVVFVPFKDGKPAGKPEDFLTGFIADKASGDVYGRPVEILQLKDGSLLVTDDVAGTIWRVSAK